jgi:hypothetical protein
MVLVADEVDIVVVGGVCDLQASMIGAGTRRRSWSNTSSIGPPVRSGFVHGRPRITYRNSSARVTGERTAAGGTGPGSSIGARPAGVLRKWLAWGHAFPCLLAACADPLGE